MKYIQENASVDAPANAETPYKLPVGAGLKGIFTSNGDQDWVRVELVAGKTYVISLAGADGNSDADTILRIYATGGELLAVNDDKDFAAGELDSMLTFSPEVSGVYYLSAGAFSGNPAQEHSGNYTLTVIDPEDDSAPEDSLPYLELEGGEGNDVLQGETGDDVIRGGAGADMLYGADGEDYLSGNAGDDLLDGGNGADLLFGDDAPPLFDASALRVEDTTDSGAALSRDHTTMNDSDPSEADATPGLPTLTREDVLAYLTNKLAAGNDILVGGAGNDWLEGGAGDDELLGGDDDDLLIGDNSFLHISSLLLTTFVAYGLAGSADPDLPQSSDSLDETLDNLTLMLVIDQLTEGNDKLDGGAGDDWLQGNGGNDVLEGGTGMDTLDGGAGEDMLNGGPGTDGLNGGAGDDILNGGADDDWLVGDAGNDVLAGGAGDDVLMGDYVAFFLAAGVGIAEPDDVHIDPAGVGVDVTTDDAALDTDANGTGGNTANVGIILGRQAVAEDYPVLLAGLVGAPGAADDSFPLLPYPALVIGPEDWFYTPRNVSGGPGDGLQPGAGFFLDGHDELSGGPGNDWLYGGHGNDLLSGGEGADVFIFAPWNGHDLITDFHAAEDKIDLTAFADITSVDDLVTRQQEDSLVIDLSGQHGGEITLQQFDAENLADIQFIFFADTDPAALA